MTIWDDILDRLRTRIPDDDFRRWFGTTAYASDSGDQITVWVPSEAVRRHISIHYQDKIESLLAEMDRPSARLRLVVGGDEEE
jgi:chromosomal replication initiation ATPase DnaA